jgi:hypothetical protein
MPVGIAIVVVRYGISKELDKEGRADLGVRLLPKIIYSLAVVRVRYKVLPPVESLERWPPSFLQLKYGITGM